MGMLTNNTDPRFDLLLTSSVDFQVAALSLGVELMFFQSTPVPALRLGLAF
jgi:hypothetical protein